MTFNLTPRSRIGAERKRIASDHAVNKANYEETVNIRRRRQGLAPLTGAALSSAAQAEYVADLDEAGRGT